MMDSGQPEPLVVRGLFLCDVVITDAQTGKASIINVFDQFRCFSFPSVPKPFVVYALLTNGFGDVNLTVEIEELTALEQVYSYTTPVRFTDRVTAMHFRLAVGTCSFPRPGSYQVVLYADGEPVAQTRLSVVG